MKRQLSSNFHAKQYLSEIIPQIKKKYTMENNPDQLIMKSCSMIIVSLLCAEARSSADTNQWSFSDARKALI